MDLRPLTKVHKFDTVVRNKPVLYRPQTYNFKANRWSSCLDRAREECGEKYEAEVVHVPHSDHAVTINSHGFSREVLQGTLPQVD